MRTYEGGRPTAGWKRGELITSLADLKVGDILISVSHQFQAENLVRVTALNTVPKSFDYNYADHRTTEIIGGGPPYGMACHEFELAGPFKASRQEYYRAIGRARKPKRKPKRKAPPMPQWLTESTN